MPSVGMGAGSGLGMGVSGAGGAGGGVDDGQRTLTLTKPQRGSRLGLDIEANVPGTVVVCEVVSGSLDPAQRGRVAGSLS